MVRYNPNFPTVTGNEFAPTATDPRNLDTATAFGYTFRTQARAGIATARVMMTQPPPGQTMRKVVSCEVYPDNVAPGTGPMRKILVPCSVAVSYLNAGSGGTGGSLAQRVGNPTDGGWVTLTGPSAGVRLSFDTGSANTKLWTALQGARIVDLSLRYAVTGEFDLHYQNMSMWLENITSGAAFEIDRTLIGEEFQYENVVTRRARIGDYNPFWNTTIDPNTDWRRGPWVGRNGSNNFLGVEALKSGAGTNIAVRLMTPTSVAVGVNAFNLHYAALEITYAEETRVAAGAIDLTPGVAVNEGLFTADVPLFSPYNWGFLWNSNAGYDYALAISQGYIGNNSVTYPVPISIDRLVSARDTFRGHKGLIFTKTLREGEAWSREETDSFPSVALYDSTTTFTDATIYPPSQVYLAQTQMQIDQSSFLGDDYQWVEDGGVAAAGTVYTHARFYARNQPATTGALQIILTNNSNVPTGPRAEISVEDFALLPEINEGWKEVTLLLDTPWVTTGGFNRVRWQFLSQTPTTAPWEVLGADANPTRTDDVSTYGATYASASGYTHIDQTDDLSSDMSVMLIQALEVPGNLAVETAVQPLTVLDEYCGVPVEAIPTGITYHQITWDPVNDLAVAGFLHYELQRRDTTMDADVWETVATVTTVGTTYADDYEARVGVVVSYRVRQVHEEGYTSAWSTTVTSTITSPGVTGAGVDSSVLILTSNHNPAGNLAYVQLWTGTGGIPSQDFTYTEAGQTTYQEMYNRDYQVAFRPLERGGVEFTRTLLINAAGVPSRTLDKGTTALRDLAWDTVPYVAVRDENHNRWLCSLEVPSSATRDIPSAGHLVIAPVQFVEVTGTPAPVDVVQGCEGLRLEGLDTYQYWTAPAPAAMAGARVLTDTFTRSASNGWGVADTGQTYTTAGPNTTDFSVNGTQGRILIAATISTDRRVVASPTFDFHRTRIDVTIPAVATGASFWTGLVTRYLDASNYIYLRVEFTTAGNFRLDVVRVLAGVTTVINTGTTISTYTIGTVIHIEEMTRGTTHTVRVWKDATTAPAWDTGGTGAVAHVTGVAPSLPMTGLVGVQFVRSASNTNVALALTYDGLTVDSLPEQYDLRALVRPFEENFYVQYGGDNYTNTNDSEGYWGVYLQYGQVGFTSYGNDFTEITSDNLTELGLVKNRETWVRAVITPDNGAGVETVQWYTLADDGVTWVLADTGTAGSPSQPPAPLMSGGLLSILNSGVGGIWTKRLEIRADGVLIASPDFEAQAVGTVAFADGQGNAWSTTGRGICATLE